MMVVLCNINQRSSAKSADAASSVWPDYSDENNFLCCELTGKTERVQKCQEREGEKTSDRNKD